MHQGDCDKGVSSIKSRGVSGGRNFSPVLKTYVLSAETPPMVGGIKGVSKG